MNKTVIKNFAIQARNKLITDISYRAGLMGISAEGVMLRQQKNVKKNCKSN